MEAGIRLNIKDSEVIGIEDLNQHNDPCVAGIAACKHSDNYKCLISNNKNAFSMKKCPIDKWVAMKIYKREDVSFSFYGKDQCFVCGSKEFWGERICNQCHPRGELKNSNSTTTYSSLPVKTKRTTARSSKSSMKDNMQESVFSIQNDDSLSDSMPSKK